MEIDRIMLYIDPVYIGMRGMNSNLLFSTITIKIHTPKKITRR
jgi:hypothetical protein